MKLFILSQESYRFNERTFKNKTLKSYQWYFDNFDAAKDSVIKTARGYQKKGFVLSSFYHSKSHVSLIMKLGQKRIHLFTSSDHMVSYSSDFSDMI